MGTYVTIFIIMVILFLIFSFIAEQKNKEKKNELDKKIKLMSIVPNNLEYEILGLVSSTSLSRRGAEYEVMLEAEKVGANAIIGYQVQHSSQTNISSKRSMGTIGLMTGGVIRTGKLKSVSSDSTDYYFASGTAVLVKEWKT